MNTCDRIGSEKCLLMSGRLRVLLDLPGNNRCADCKRQKPRWASTNLGIFLCMRCSGVHRSLGTQISKVKSISLDKWTSDQLEQMERIGNTKANLVWERHLPTSYQRPTWDGNGDVETFIKEKYISKKWAEEKTEKVQKREDRPSDVIVVKVEEKLEMPSFDLLSLV